MKLYSLLLFFFLNNRLRHFSFGIIHIYFLFISLYVSTSIFIDSEWFLELSKDKLKKFNYEASSFYKENLTLEQRKLISPEPRLNKKESELDKMELKDVQLYILNEIDILLEVQKEEIKYMINYILIGALGIVIPEIKELYPDFSFAFNAE